MSEASSARVQVVSHPSSPRPRLLWLSTRVDYDVSETSTRYQRLSSLCDHYELHAVMTEPLDDRYHPAQVEAVSRHPRRFLQAAWQARRSSADIVSTSGQPLSLIGAVLAKAKRPLVIQVWDDPAKMARIRADVSTGRSAIRAKAQLRLMEGFTRWMLSRAELIVLSLDPARIGTLYSIPEEKILAVTNGALLDTADERDPADEKSQDPPLVVYTGPLQTARIETLLNAAGELHQRGTPARVRLLGPKMSSEYDQRVDELLERASPNVEIDAGLHSGQRLRDAVGEADICVIPYLDTFEIDCTYPIKLFEYFTAAKPVVSTRLWGVQKVATDGHDVVLVEPGDASELAAGIEALVQDADRRHQLGRNARSTAERYSWEHINDRVLEAMDRLTDGAGHRR